MKKGYLYDGETVIRESFRHLGFARVTETVMKAFQLKQLEKLYLMRYSSHKL